MARSATACAVLGAGGAWRLEVDIRDSCVGEVGMDIVGDEDVSTVVIGLRGCARGCGREEEREASRVEVRVVGRAEGREVGREEVRGEGRDDVRGEVREAEREGGAREVPFSSYGKSEMRLSIGIGSLIWFILFIVCRLFSSAFGSCCASCGCCCGCFPGKSELDKQINIKHD